MSGVRPRRRTGVSDPVGVGGPLIIDASIVAAWLFEDEASTVADRALVRVATSGGRVPGIWPFEVANVVAGAERRGRVPPERADRMLAALTALPIEVDDRAPGAALVTLVGVARAHRLTAYDAAYLELAIRAGLPLATLDDALAAAAVRAGVSLFEG